MRIPTIRGVIDRRILLNFRVSPEILSAQLPAPFRPQLANGFGIAGICLIRLQEIRPRLLPPLMGLSSENAAHRIAVEWDTESATRTGVFIPRRDTSSPLNTFAGGRLFPGVHNRAQFDVRETDTHFQISLRSTDAATRVAVEAHTTTRLPHDSVFPSLAEASRFFEAGSLGYSPQAIEGQFDGLELKSFGWHVEPLRVTQVSSSYFDDQALFPPGSIHFDHALLMRGIEHEWHGRESLCCTRA